MLSKNILKQVLASNQTEVENYKVFARLLPSDDFPLRVLVGVRRAGKSFMLYQKMQEMLAGGHRWNEMLYLNFEDDRLGNFELSDFETILAAHYEMYGTRPMLFLDEMQNVEGWEKFARRLADEKYSVWISGSNAKMLSTEVLSSLGGRYLATEVYPYNFKEYLDFQNIKYDSTSLLATASRANLLSAFNLYLYWGGLPETVEIIVKRDYLSSTFQKIYLGDICSRNNVSNPYLMRLMIKKIAENVGQPVSYNRIANVLTSAYSKITMPTISKYIEYCEDARLLLRLRNVSAPFAEKETLCKYYFIDNGILNLFLLNGKNMLLENMVALALFRKYGHDLENERVFFYKDRTEIDFYIPEDELAIQVSYTVSESYDTYEREINALSKIPKVLPCKRRLVLTSDERNNIEDEFGSIEVMPVWQWLLNVDLL